MSDCLLQSVDFTAFFPRFWSKVNFDGPTPENRPELGPCWVWTASGTRGGYGRFGVAGALVLAHRFSYEMLVRELPKIDQASGKRLEIDHLCRNPACVNPEHLEPVTQPENIRRGFGACACNARKTHCPQGHSYSGVNLIVDRKGHRYCRTCRVESHRRHRLKSRGVS